MLLNILKLIDMRVDLDQWSINASIKNQKISLKEYSLMKSRSNQKLIRKFESQKT